MIQSRKSVSKSEVVTTSGMVTAMHPLAAQAGVEVLQADGNAADAAIAAALAIGVVEPFMSGLGGCAYAVSYDTKTKRTMCFDGSAVAPLGARDDMFELEDEGEHGLGLYGWRATKGEASETGHRAVTVPGAPAALAKLHEASGRLPWRELFGPAIRLAEEGHAVSEYFFAQSAASLERVRRFDGTMAAFFEPSGAPKPPAVERGGASLLKLPELAGTLRRLAEDGVHAFYRGDIASTIASHLKDHGGELTREDFAAYEARTLEPLETPYRSATVLGLPEASGGPTVSFALRALEAFPIRELAYDAPDRLHILAETLRLAYGDRFRFLGDPHAAPVPMSGLLSEGYVSERRALIVPDGQTSPEVPDGDPWNYDESRGHESRGNGEAPGQHTTHVNVVDRERNVVSLSATLGARFGSGVTVPGTGVVLNNGIMWYDPEPGHSASLARGKRALHASAPTIVTMNGTPYAAIGTPGARKIMGAIVQVVSNLIDRDMGMQEAIEAPRIHRDAAPGILVDGRFGDEVTRALEARGYDVTTAFESFMSAYFARPSGIRVDVETGRLYGGVEPYRAGTAAGY